MEIRTTYVYTFEKEGNSYTGMSCGKMPENFLEITEERPVLHPVEGMELEHIETKERFSAVWLKDGDVQENYVEVEIKELVEKVEDGARNTSR